MTPQRVLALSLLWLLASCDGCGGGDHLAKLVSHEGGADRDYAASIEKWQEAEDGAVFDEGDGLRTADDGVAMVHVTGAGKVRLEGDTLVRFFAHGRPDADAPQAAGIEVQTGSALVEALEAEMPLKTSTGIAIVKRGSNVRVRKADRGMSYEVELGSAVFTGVGGEKLEVEQGQSIEVGIGLAEIGAVFTEEEVAAEPEPEPEPEAELPGAIDAVVRGVVRSRGAQDEQWEQLEQGLNRVGAGAELKLEGDGQVDLTRGDQRATLKRGSYRLGQEGEALLSAADGTVTVTAKGSDVRLRVPGGVIITKGGNGGSTAEVKVDGDEGRTQLKATSGQVVTEGEVGEHTLSNGDEVTLARGDRGDEAEEVAGWKPGLAQAELVVGSGQSFRIYDPSPPAAVGFDPPDKCKHGAQLTVAAGNFRAATKGGSLNVALASGLHKYRVYCLQEDGTAKRRATRRGAVRVVKSRGTRKLSTSAPKNDIAADGRRYTLMYQGRLPVVTVRWPRAPAAPRYVLFVRGPSGKTRKYKSKGPKVELPEDALSNGKHTAYFTAVESGGKRSKETTFHVAFDNAAPTASIADPPVAGFAPGAVKVAGLALAGTEISVGGQKIPLDKKQRFNASVNVSPGQTTLAIRFKHKKHGVRYYLRRVSGAGR